MLCISTRQNSIKEMEEWNVRFQSLESLVYGGDNPLALVVVRNVYCMVLYTIARGVCESDGMQWKGSKEGPHVSDLLITHEAAVLTLAQQRSLSPADLKQMIALVGKVGKAIAHPVKVPDDYAIAYTKYMRDHPNDSLLGSRVWKLYQTQTNPEKK